MKTRTMFLALLIYSTSVMAQDSRYVEEMSKQIATVYSAQTTEELLAAVNSLDRIARVEKEKWEPSYYGAFGYIMLANREKDLSKKDGYLDEALDRVKQATAISKGNSEITALEGFVHMIRVSVDPAARGQQFSGMSMQAFGKALGQDPNNPRALALYAQMQYGTATFLKSSTAEACGMAKKALEQFIAAKNDQPLSPKWGREMTEGMLKNCNH